MRPRRQARECAANQEHNKESALDVDAHAACDLRIIDTGAYFAPQARVLKQKMQGGEHDQADKDNEQSIGGIGLPGDAQTAGKRRA